MIRLFISLLLLSVLSCQKSQVTNWAMKPSLWHPATDELGSQLDTTGGFFQDSSLRVQFTITKKTTEVWPYVELIFESPENFQGSQGVELEYQCDQELVVKLFQEDFGPAPKGNDTYSLYQTKVPSSLQWKTLRLNFSDFQFPSWVPEKSKGIAMNLEKTQKIYLTPALDATLGGSSLLRVRGLRFLKQ